MTDAIINQFASYKALIKEAARFNNEKYHLKNLLSQPNRFESLCAKMDGFFLDYSQQRLVQAVFKNLISLAKEAGAIVPFIRPSNLAKDLTTTEDTLKHALLTYEEMIGKQFELAVFLTATDIFRNPCWIKEGIDKMRKDSNLESVFSGHAVHKNFWEKQENGSWKRVKDWMADYSSRQVRRNIIREDTGLMCVSRASLWREGHRIGDRVEIIINNDGFTGIDIHEKEDLLLANSALKIRNQFL